MYEGTSAGPEVESSAAKAAAEQARTRRLGIRTGLVAGLLGPALLVGSILLGDATATGVDRVLAILGWFLLFVLPMDVVMTVVNTRAQRRTNELVGTLLRQLDEAAAEAARQAAAREGQVRHQEFERRLANALEMAEGEPEVIGVVERCFSAIVPDSPVELLLADNSHAHLLRMASASPTPHGSGCPVDAPDHCPAARRAQVQQFPDSGALDACPKLRDRPGGPLSAACVPVSMMGRTVGVIHATGRVGATMDRGTVNDLATLANLAGARIGLLRVVADTQLQAGTDSLTGLLNRRSLEQKVRAVREQATKVALVMADLDRFKALNDTYGHDTGDRALRLFARVLTESVRAEDLVCRYGGEEFVLALPGCSAGQVLPLLEAVRARLEAAVSVAGLPGFTASFGVTDAEAHEDLVTVVDRADGALFEAKRQGRDRVVVHPTEGAALPEGAAEEGVVGAGRTPPELPARP